MQASQVTSDQTVSFCMKIIQCKVKGYRNRVVIKHPESIQVNNTTLGQDILGLVLELVNCNGFLISLWFPTKIQTIVHCNLI